MTRQIFTYEGPIEVIVQEGGFADSSIILNNLTKMHKSAWSGDKELPITLSEYLEDNFEEFGGELDKYANITFSNVKITIEGHNGISS